MKELIINETINLFNEYGCKFSMETLSKNLQISKKTLYKYFSSKEKLITYIIDESFNEVHKKQSIIYTSKKDTETKLREILTTNFTREDKIKMEKAIGIYKYYPILSKKIESRYREEWDLVTNLLIKGSEEGIFEYWSLSYTIELLKSAMSLVIKNLDGKTTYTQAINKSMNALVNSLKKGK